MKKEQSTVAIAFSFLVFLFLYNYAYEFVISQTVINLRIPYIISLLAFYLFIFYTRKKKVNRPSGKVPRR
ncbi:hypothetical protein ADIAL_1151 [Alkalibacterium sp. AK22]|uniref:hypothetical protein n=1 Tax=Alkalibacterium sp. AK22 TaxID=1229520 RepID=UPI00044826F9|nr:hypothetical protein [Alkalibacterium sp. AK22]EXJ23393.1 hypothetical protein ADIAL_1151 [Alkalibacterium sp. AK22]